MSLLPNADTEAGAGAGDGGVRHGRRGSARLAGGGGFSACLNWHATLRWLAKASRGLIRAGLFEASSCASEGGKTVTPGPRPHGCLGGGERLATPPARAGARAARRPRAAAVAEERLDELLAVAVHAAGDVKVLKHPAVHVALAYRIKLLVRCVALGLQLEQLGVGVVQALQQQLCGVLSAGLCSSWYWARCRQARSAWTTWCLVPLGDYRPLSLSKTSTVADPFAQNQVLMRPMVAMKRSGLQ
eukprot:SAG22_NODE_3985_length_1436_cov_41.234106_1_plen_244_part_00